MGGRCAQATAAALQRAYFSAMEMRLVTRDKCQHRSASTGAEGLQKAEKRRECTMKLVLRWSAREAPCRQAGALLRHMQAQQAQGKGIGVHVHVSMGAHVCA